MNRCNGCGGPVHGRVTLHRFHCTELPEPEPEPGIAASGCATYYVGCDDGVPLVVIGHSACAAASA
jgi:hypothetical protein